MREPSGSCEIPEAMATRPDPPSPPEHIIPDTLHKRPLDGVVRALFDLPWSEARRRIETGKIRVAGEVVTDPTRAVRKGDKLAYDARAPKPRTAARQRVEQGLVVYVDPCLVVVNKPAGVSTVPFGEEDDGELTLDALVRDVVARRDHLRGRAPLGVVHRLDKATSGLLVFSRTVAAKKHLGQQLRVHTTHRKYLAIAHGIVTSRTIRSHIVEDRGDGLRGSKPEGRGGQLAVTHVERIEPLAGATLIACTLETGRTHQIRVHLSEAGHPIVGEPVYIRGYRGDIVSAPRLMLHATELGFIHPESERPMRFTVEPPLDFQETLERLRVTMGA